MKQPYLRCLIILLCLSMASGLMAQLPETQASDTQFSYPEMGFFLHYQQPTGVLHQNGYRNGWGFSTEMMSRPLRDDRFINLQFGGSFRYDHAGSERFDVIASYPYRAAAEQTIRNQQLGLHGIARLITSAGYPVQAYVQGMVGTRLFLSETITEIEGLDHDDDYCPEPEFLSSQASLSYGGAAGLRFRIGSSAWFDVRGTYLTGSSVSYVDLASAQMPEENVVVYNLASAPRNDQWSVSLGVTFQLRSDEDGCDDDESDSSSWILPAMIFTGCN